MHTYKCVVIKCSVQHNVEKESALVTDEIFILKLFLKLGLDESTSGPQGKKWDALIDWFEPVLFPNSTWL